MKFELAQKQTFAHQNIQGLNILSMNTFELGNYIAEIAMENPVLVVEDSPPEDVEKSNLISKLQWLESGDEQNKAYYKANLEANETLALYEAALQMPGSLADFLSEQIEYINLSEEESEICLQIIHRLDDNGYLDKNFHLFEEFLVYDTQSLQLCLLAVQALEPTGVGARSLSECLKLQLGAKNITDEIMLKLVENDLAALSKKQFAKLAKKYKITQSRISGYFETIAQLNPKPGANYTNEIYHQYIIVDAIIRNVQGEFIIELNTWNIPRISISKTYLDKYNSIDDTQTKKYIEEKLKQAKSVTNNISKRNDTLLKVTAEILKKQKLFFENGTGNIKPLKMSDIAENLSVHPSTISRAIKGKYLQCDFGVFSYRHFFSNEIASNNGEGESSEKVRDIVKNLISTENKACPLSDQKLAESLNESGIQIKRRTVSKYRNELKIAPAYMRKK